MSKNITKVLKLCPPWLSNPLLLHVAGITREDATAKVVELEQKGIRATLDVLGEAAAQAQKVKSYVDEYKILVDTIVKNQHKSGISIKPTAFGLGFDKTLAQTSMEELIQYAKAKNVFVRIDMEDSPTTDWTIDFYKRVKKNNPRVGLVLQAYLRRTLADIESLPDSDAESLRLCKGIYIEPKEIAYKGYHEVNQNYLLCLEATFKNRFT